MPDPQLQAYLAQHYLSGPKADAILARQRQDSSDEQSARKRKKRKVKSSAADSPSSGSGLRLVDEADAWRKADENEDDDLREAQVTREESKSRFKKGGWASLAGKAGADRSVGSSNTGLVEEPAIDDEDEPPQLAGANGVNLDSDAAAQVARAQAQQSREASRSEASSSSLQKPRAGLKTREEVRAERLERERQEEAERQERLAANGGREDEEARLAQQTIYRDASGRKIDVEAEEVAAKKEEERKRRKEREKKEWNRGERQREEERRAREEAAKVKNEGVARYATDERMNAELKAMERSDDPALAFLTKKRDKGPRLPTYKGPAPPPNRFGMPPGYRWDGVDRGNGFEKKLFEARGARLRREQDERTFGTSDM